MDPHLFGPALRLPFPAAILEIADQLAVRRQLRGVRHVHAAVGRADPGRLGAKGKELKRSVLPFMDMIIRAGLQLSAEFDALRST